MEEIDLVVVGAGWYGLAAAKTYIELHPHETILVLDKASSVGGVWGRDRLYPGLKSNNMLGTYEYSDFPMDTATFGVSPGEHIPGIVVHEYLTAYAKQFGVYERIRFNSRVESAEEKNTGVGGWSLGVVDTLTEEKTILKTKRLIVATGLASEPSLPVFSGQETFIPPIFHSKDFAAHKDTLNTARSIAILGGAKSAWDAAYAYATAGVPVDMIIRDSGRGPVWMAPAYVTPLKKWLEKLVHTRLLQWFSPCIWGDEDGFSGVRLFLHGTWLGRKIVDAFWAILSADVVALNGFDDPKYPEMRKLKPRHSAFWIGSGLSILNYPTNFFDLVRSGAIHVHVADITHLSAQTIHLSNGDSITPSALLCATGWKTRPSINFLPEVGMSDHDSTTPDPLLSAADSFILNKFPRLQSQPHIPTTITSSDKPSNSTQQQQLPPLLLHRFIAPLSSLPPSPTPTLAFAGLQTTISTSLIAQTQALWITAYFSRKLSRLPSSAAEARWETLLHARFGRWRYPCGYGAGVPDFVFDAVPYVDMLLRDLGLEGRRKGGWREVVEPYGVKDYKGLVGEWVHKVGGSGDFESSIVEGKEDHV